MNRVSDRRWLRAGGWLLLAAALLAFVVGFWLDLGWRRDRAVLRAVAERVAGGLPPGPARLTRLTDWVYHNQGFAKNQQYFLVKRLEATPLQILAHGGDCADKSRLLAALGRELGDRVSMAMLFPCPGCVAAHTVALVDTPQGWTASDPVYDIVFPDGQGGLMPVARLRSDPGLLPARLDALVAARGRDDKIALYKRSLETYDRVSTFNWDKNAATRAAATVIRWTGAQPWAVARPAIMDDPKHLLAATALGSGAVLLLLGAWLLWLARGGRRARPGIAPARSGQSRGYGTA